MIEKPIDAVSNETDIGELDDPTQLDTELEPPPLQVGVPPLAPPQTTTANIRSYLVQKVNDPIATFNSHYSHVVFTRYLECISFMSQFSRAPVGSPSTLERGVWTIRCRPRGSNVFPFVFSGLNATKAPGIVLDSTGNTMYAVISRYDDFKDFMVARYDVSGFTPRFIGVQYISDPTPEKFSVVASTVTGRVFILSRSMFHIIDTTTHSVRSRTFFTGPARTVVQYPLLVESMTVSGKAVLTLGWTNYGYSESGNFGSLHQNHYLNSFAVQSWDNGETFGVHGQGLTLPISPEAGLGLTYYAHADAAKDRASSVDTQVFNWMDTMKWQIDPVTGSSLIHYSYEHRDTREVGITRGYHGIVDWNSGRVIKLNLLAAPLPNGKWLQLGGIGKMIEVDPVTNRLYAVGAVDAKKVGVLVSHDGGRSWKPFAISNDYAGSIYALNGRLDQLGRKLLCEFTVVKGSESEVHLLEIQLN